MSVPEELHYTPEHEWVAISGSVASVGITDHAQRALGDVVFVSAPAPGTKVTAGEPCGEVESTKSVSDLYSPVDGEVTEVNPETRRRPGARQLRSVRGRAGCSRSAWQEDGDGDLPPGLLSAAEYTALTAIRSRGELSPRDRGPRATGAAAAPRCGRSRSRPAARPTAAAGRA